VRGTITTMIINTTQQDQRWKAYIGNVSGSLSLRDANNVSIYAWALATMSGQVYASRYGNLSWTSISCAPAGLIINESNYFGMANSNPDRINATFYDSTHKSYQIGGNTINTADRCNSTATYVNGTAQTLTTASPYQELLIRDGNGYLVYMTDISYQNTGYDGQKYDFQMLVAENTTGSATPYYFYAELR
jgi:hypothetical protein